MALPASQGFVWLRDAFRALRNQPLALSGIVVFNILMMAILSSLPFVGLVVSSFWVPFGVVLTAEATRESLAGRIPRYTPLKEAWQDRFVRMRLLMLGVISALGMEVITTVFTWLGREEINQWVIDDKGISLESVLTHFPYTAAGVAMLLNILFWMATSFPPLLIHRGRQETLQSVFYSFFGVLKNFLPVTVFVLSLALVTIGFAALSVALQIVLNIPNMWSYVAPFAVVFLSVLVQSGTWTIYRDVFQGSR